MKWLLTSTAIALMLGITPAEAGGEKQRGAEAPSPTPQVLPGGTADATETKRGGVVTEEAEKIAQNTISARDLIGADVVGPDRKSVGTVDDLVLGGDSIRHVIIADGAVLGFGGKNVAIDFAGSQVQRSRNSDDPRLRISMTDQALERAAEFDKSALQDSGERLASAYIERTVKLASGDQEGEINDLLIDRSGRIDYAVIEFGGVLDVGDRPIAVDADKLRSAPEGQPMILALTPAELERAPALRSGEPQM